MQRSLAHHILVHCFLFSVAAVLSVSAQSVGGSRSDVPAPQVESVDPQEIRAMLDFVPEIVATVDGEAVTGTQVKGVVVPTLTAVISAGSPPPTEEELHTLVRQVTGQLVDQQVLFHVCRSQGYEPEYEAADEKIGELKKNAGDAEFEKALQRQGVTPEQFRKQIANMVAFNKWLQQEVLKTLQVTDAEIEEFYRANQDKLVKQAKVEVSHILIELPEGADENAENAAYREIEEIQQKLENGVPFAQLAQLRSACPSAKSGGRLEPFGRNEMVKPFEEAAFALDEGETSDVVRTNYGLHLIRCIKRIPVSTIPLDECKRELTQRLMNYKLNARLQDAIALGKSTLAVEFPGDDQ